MLSLSSSQSSFIGMMRDSSDRHSFRLEMWKVLWTFSEFFRGLQTVCRICTSLSVGSWDYFWSCGFYIGKYLYHPFKIYNTGLEDVFRVFNGYWHAMPGGLFLWSTPL
ncbi:hypothetical protein Tco_0077761 [Tanacetum coccineum]